MYLLFGASNGCNHMIVEYTNTLYLCEQYLTTLKFLSLISESGELRFVTTLCDKSLLVVFGRSVVFSFVGFWGYMIKLFCVNFHSIWLITPA